MPEEVIEKTAQQTQQEAVAQVQEQNINELDNALSKAFGVTNPAESELEKKEVSNEEKTPVEKPVAQVKESTPETNKDNNQEKGKPNNNLPDPDKIGEPPAKSKGNREGWDALKNNYRQAHRLAQEREAEIVKLKKEVADKVTGSTKEAETLKQQIAELNKYRAMVDIQADPEFISKYDEPIKKNTDSIKGLLRSLQVDDNVINGIDFSNTQGVAKLMDQVVDWVGQHRDKFTSRKLQRQVEDLMDLTDKRNEMLTEHKSNYQKHLEDKKKESFSKSAEHEGRMHSRIDQIIAMRNAENQPEVAFLNKQDVPEGANQAQIQQIENHNNLTDAMQAKVKEFLSYTEPEKRADIAVMAVGSLYLNAQNKAKDKKIASLEAELKKISTASDETPKTKMRTASNGRFASQSNMDSTEALESFLANRK